MAALLWLKGGSRFNSNYITFYIISIIKVLYHNKFFISIGKTIISGRGSAVGRNRERGETPKQKHLLLQADRWQWSEGCRLDLSVYAVKLYQPGTLHAEICRLCQDRLVFVYVRWVLPQGMVFKCVVGDSRKIFRCS